MIVNKITIHLRNLLSGLKSYVDHQWRRSVQVQFYVELLAFK